MQTLDDVVAGSVGRPRLMSALTGLFGALAGMLAMIGVYGVMAYNVRRQRREFGIRLALGANESKVRNLVVARGLTLAAIGVTIGAAASWLMTRCRDGALERCQTDGWQRVSRHGRRGAGSRSAGLVSAGAIGVAGRSDGGVEGCVERDSRIDGWSDAQSRFSTTAVVRVRR